MTTVKPYAACQFAFTREGRWIYRTQSRHTTSAAAANAAGMKAMLGGGLWRVRDDRSGEWVTELDSRPADVMAAQGSPVDAVEV